MAIKRVLPWARLLLCFVLLVFFTPAAQPRLTPPWQSPHVFAFDAPGVVIQGSPEEMIVATIDAVRAGRMADARATVDALLVKEPNYRLAHLVSADLYAMRAAPLASLGGGAIGPSDRLDDLRREAQVRLLRRADPPPLDKLPAQLLVLSPRQKHVVLVDAEASRVYLYANDNGVPRHVTDFYVTVGKLGTDKLKEGDQRTPLGVYFVTSHMDRPQLDRIYGSYADLYGVGAWPISYPNELDRREGRTGSGIWLHGSPAETYARAPQASNGCVVLTNDDMQKLAQWLTPGETPVVNVAHVEWLSRAAWQSRHDAALATLENWRNAWQNRDTDRYLGFYDDEFRSSEGQDLPSWRRQKTQVNSGKNWTEVKLDDVSIFVTGNERPMWVATFNQVYRSDTLNNQMRKRLYWRPDGGTWKIHWEGPARAG
ncbi:L,D-transpeptidase family protein [Chitinolyticbacter albus]|uniref:L,D-transpeptidase family protein n=1 Tax=Chitinolyticbacter albus TaxID=2961951 RepID=UPI00210D06DA|nr:L,D-transpeptidase family protein [Chitinolyticbacter albus]